MADNSVPAARDRLRFGLAGTGFWARVAHARALASTPGIEFAAVWGRNLDAAAHIAAEHGVTAHRDFDAFLADVDAVAFSIPPDVQSELALRVATAGKHLLLEKPVSTQASAATALAQAVDAAKVASVVFFTALFQADIRAWLAEVSDRDWAGARAVWLGSALAEASPFNTPWRREKGGLWDLGPHALSLLWPTLGEVLSVTADSGALGASHLILHHPGNATSTVTVTLEAPSGDDRFEIYLWGKPGRSSAPALADDPVPALRVALTELADNAKTGNTRHPCDVRFGCEVTKLLAQAQEQIDARGHGHR
jgi:predicted dehydrogenase